MKYHCNLFSHLLCLTLWQTKGMQVCPTTEFLMSTVLRKDRTLSRWGVRVPTFLATSARALASALSPHYNMRFYPWCFSQLSHYSLALPLLSLAFTPCCIVFVQYVCSKPTPSSDYKEEIVTCSDLWLKGLFIHQEQNWVRHENVWRATVSEPTRFLNHELLLHTITTNVSGDTHALGPVMCDQPEARTTAYIKPTSIVSNKILIWILAR